MIWQPRSWRRQLHYLYLQTRVNKVFDNSLPISRRTAIPCIIEAPFSQLGLEQAYTDRYHFAIIKFLHQ